MYNHIKNSYKVQYYFKEAQEDGREKGFFWSFDNYPTDAKKFEACLNTLINWKAKGILKVGIIYDYTKAVRGTDKEGQEIYRLNG